MENEESNLNKLADTVKQSELKVNDANKQREEIHKKIWDIANSLRGSVDGWDFKVYVLTIMFYKYLSQKLINAFKKETTPVDYANMDDEKALSKKDAIVDKFGFFIKPSELFCNVVKKAPEDKDLNIHLLDIFKHIEDYVKNSSTFDNFKGLFADFNLNKLVGNKSDNTKDINQKLVDLLQKINEMQIGSYDQANVDPFGDAYEFLISMYSSNAGKSGGEFFTPQEVSNLLMRLAISNFKNPATEINRIYDPACGSGSLLLQAIKLLGKDNSASLTLKGQEINSTTYNLCRMNMFLHDVSPSNFKIANADTLIDPWFKDEVENGKKFDIIVSNPPYSIKWVGKDDPTLINDPRFAPAGELAPKTKADLAFIMHALYYLSEKGTACIVCFPGILYRGGAEKKIREYLVNNGYIDCIIQLPMNLFFGTGIATDIMVLRKNRNNSDEIFFIDASNEFIKVKNNNKLTDDNINKIVAIYHDKKDVPYIAKMVKVDVIKENDYSLNVAKYVEKKDETPKIDINKLNAEIAEIVKKSDELRKAINALTENIKVTDSNNSNCDANNQPSNEKLKDDENN